MHSQTMYSPSINPFDDIIRLRALRNGKPEPLYTPLEIQPPDFLHSTSMALVSSATAFHTKESSRTYRTSPTTPRIVPVPPHTRRQIPSVLVRRTKPVLQQSAALSRLAVSLRVQLSQVRS